MSFYFEEDQLKEDIVIFHLCILAILLCMLLLCYLTKGTYLDSESRLMNKSVEGMSPSTKPMETEWSLFNRNPYDDVDYQTPVFIRQTSFH